MVIKLLCGLLLATFLGQGWAQSGVIMSAEPVSQTDCMDHVKSDAGCKCCPDGARVGGACFSLCAASVALACVLPELTVSRGQLRTDLVQPAPAGPRYLPLNPPPIA